MLNVTLFVPVLNERACMEKIMPRIPHGLFAQILVVDGGSKDGSAEWAKAQGYDVVYQKPKGLHYAYSEGFPHIKSEWVITFSPDGNCVPEDLERLVQKASEGSWDMVIGSRYAKGAKSEDDDIITGFGNWMFTTLINVCFGGRYTDVMNILRIYRKQTYYDLDIHLDASHNTEKLFFTVVGVEPLISMRAAKRKLRIADIPCNEPKRLHGKRKLQIVRWGLAHLLQIGKELVSWR